MKRILLGLVFVLGGCTSMVKCEDVTVAGGTLVSYCMGKVSGDGQEGNFRDAYIDGKPVLSNYGNGSSLWGQALQGAAGDAAIAGGMYGAARALRPSNTNNTVGSANQQGQSQGQSEEVSSNVTNAPKTSVSASGTGGSATGGSATSGSTSGAVSKSGAKSSSESSATSGSSSNSTSTGAPSKPSKPNKPGKPEKEPKGNHSGGGDGTNPGGHGNENGYDNPGKGKKD